MFNSVQLVQNGWQRLQLIVIAICGVYTLSSPYFSVRHSRESKINHWRKKKNASEQRETLGVRRTKSKDATFFFRLTPRVPRGAPTAIVLLPIFFLLTRTTDLARKQKVHRVLSKVWFTTLPTQQHSIVGRNFAFLYSFHITLCSSCAEETRLAKEAGIPVVKTGYWTWWHVAVVTHTFVLLQVFI